MGRYYSGDIEGKFWFGIQSSDDADFFGVDGYDTQELRYYYGESDLDGVEDGIKACKKALGRNEKKLDDYFSKNNTYNEKMIADQTGIAIEKIPDLLEWYARLELGIKIRDCIKKNGYCNFTAEL